jgi:hypothetical protein
MSLPAELAEGFSNLSSKRMFLYPRRARCRAVDDPIVPPPPTMRIALSRLIMLKLYDKGFLGKDLSTARPTGRADNLWRLSGRAGLQVSAKPGCRRDRTLRDSLQPTYSHGTMETRYADKVSDKPGFRQRIRSRDYPTRILLTIVLCSKRGAQTLTGRIAYTLISLTNLSLATVSCHWSDHNLPVVRVLEHDDIWNQRSAK